MLADGKEILIMEFDCDIRYDTGNPSGLCESDNRPSAAPSRHRARTQRISANQITVLARTIKVGDNNLIRHLAIRDPLARGYDCFRSTVLY